MAQNQVAGTSGNHWCPLSSRPRAVLRMSPSRVLHATCLRQSSHSALPTAPLEQTAISNHFAHQGLLFRPSRHTHHAVTHAITVARPGVPGRTSCHQRSSPVGNPVRFCRQLSPQFLVRHLSSSLIQLCWPAHSHSHCVSLVPFTTRRQRRAGPFNSLINETPGGEQHSTNRRLTSARQKQTKQRLQENQTEVKINNVFKFSEGQQSKQIPITDSVLKEGSQSLSITAPLQARAETGRLQMLMRSGRNILTHLLNQVRKGDGKT